MNMKNMGTVDKSIRIIVGLALIIWAVMGGPIWAWIGLLPLATAIMGWCPAYSLIGVSTQGKSEKTEASKDE